MRISFNKEDAEELYELSLKNFQKDCHRCNKIKKRLEAFIGEKAIRRIKLIIRNYPYDEA